MLPTTSPTASPVVMPTASPSMPPTTSPTASPTMPPTTSPTASPAVMPTASPTNSPTMPPTSSSPTSHPTASPVLNPSDNGVTDWILGDFAASCAATCLAATGSDQCDYVVENSVNTEARIEFVAGSLPSPLTCNSFVAKSNSNSPSFKDNNGECAYNTGTVSNCDEITGNNRKRFCCCGSVGNGNCPVL
uniref:Uncharacterized protein n=1 Tax=Entomoneis paludosa TaxID=265537 RepID=A0A7S3DQ52_9STRA